MDDAANAIESIFTEALGLPSPAQRAGFLAAACGNDTRLRARVEALLEAHDRAGSFMAPGAEAAGASAATVDIGPGVEPFRRPSGPAGEDPLAEQPGTVIGRYKLLQQIGEGGFGVVFMAEQEQPVRRRVALKIIKAGMDTRAVIARFEAERQALAMMDHPNIARVLDAGATDAGRPYFVMELVKGIPITDYCDQANLGTRQRLELFIDVCRAVQHAHQKGIIHRDLKPSNIMVTLRDDKPNVKVIDFGIAKATDQKLTEKTLFTNYGQMIGTPVYMSPEQAVMSEFDVDTRSDVYSLGVLLYELLAGSPPFDAQTLRNAGFDEMRRIIREESPQKPSTRLSTLAQEAKLTVATRRQVSPQALSRQLHGDLDWIVLKSIEKDRTRRYESASAFAQDIERHLKSEPVTAVAPGALYHLRKFTQRNKGPMAAAAAIALLLVAGTTVSTWEAVRATRAKADAVAAAIEKGKANEQAQKRLTQIEKANDILGSIFESLDPSAIAQDGRPLQAILVEKLDRAVKQLDGDAIGDPLVVAAMQNTFGSSLLGLGEPNKAIVLFRQACDTRGARLGRDHPDTLTSMSNLADAYYFAGKLDLALPLYEETLKLRKVRLGHEHEDTLSSMGRLAMAYLGAGKLDPALPLCQEALSLEEAKLGRDYPDTLNSMDNLALVYCDAGKLDLAVPLFEETLKLRKAKLGVNHPDTLTSMNHLAEAYQTAGKLVLAVPLFEETLKLRKAQLGDHHPDTLTSMNDLAGAYQAAGKLDLALPLFEETLKLRKAKLGPDDLDTLVSMSDLAGAYYDAGKLELAVQLYEGTLKLQQAKLGPEHPYTLSSMNNLAEMYQAAGKLDLALPLFEETLKLRKAKLGPDDADTLRTARDLADVRRLLDQQNAGTSAGKEISK